MAATAPIRLLVIGEFAYSSGSSNIIQQYARHASEIGFELRISAEFGKSDRRVRAAIEHCPDASWATHALIIYEGSPFLSDADLARLDRAIPHVRRAVVDADGHCAPLIAVGDDNNAWPCGQAEWQRSFAAAGAVVLQPALGPLPEGIIRFPYFGFPPCAESNGQIRRKAVEMQYVGNNWFRYQPVLDVFAAMREAVPGARLRLRGRGWDGTSLPGLKHATFADVAQLERLDIDVRRPAPFGRVVDCMSHAAISPVLVRPVLSQLNLLTPRMLETAAADTIPVYNAEDAYIGNLYGDGGELCLGGAPTEKLAQLHTNLPYYQSQARDIRHELQAQYSYPALLAQLRTVLNSV